jgi:hypothetical protein
VSVLAFARALFDKVTYAEKSDIRQEHIRLIEDAMQAKSKADFEKNEGSGFEAAIQKEFEFFNYRNVVPLLTEMILSALPNEKNNPEQSQLYSAFAAGDADTVLKTPRKERKQIFITDMQVYFEEDVDRYSVSERRWDPLDYTGSSSMQGVGAVRQGEPGFMVTMVGYIPYDSRRVYELMDPAGVEDDPAKWGFITRLSHLDDIVDGNSPFKLYKKTGGDKHFKLKVDDVEPPQELSSSDPTNIFRGIGVVEIRYEKMRTTSMGTSRRIVEMSDSIDEAMVGVRVLIDPMTKEIISKVAEMDEDGKAKLVKGKPVYTVNDSWFILNLKFAWKDAPEPPAPPASTMPVDYGYDSRWETSARPPGGTAEQGDAERSGGRSIGIDDF